MNYWMNYSKLQLQWHLLEKCEVAVNLGRRHEVLTHLNEQSWRNYFTFVEKTFCSETSLLWVWLMNTHTPWEWIIKIDEWVYCVTEERMIILMIDTLLIPLVNVAHARCAYMDHTTTSQKLCIVRRKYKGLQLKTVTCHLGPLWLRRWSSRLPIWRSVARSPIIICRSVLGLDTGPQVARGVCV